jgi:uncharacterized membrane protein HdeD (DUF308 family)
MDKGTCTKRYVEALYIGCGYLQIISGVCIIRNTLSCFVAYTSMFGIVLVIKGLASSGYGLNAKIEGDNTD